MISQCAGRMDFEEDYATYGRKPLRAYRDAQKAPPAPVNVRSDLHEAFPDPSKDWQGQGLHVSIQQPSFAKSRASRGTKHPTVRQVTIQVSYCSFWTLYFLKLIRQLVVICHLALNMQHS